jgi:vacuolar-type H+-ATPase subunit I/STV1
LPNKEVLIEFRDKVIEWVINRIGTDAHAKVIEAIWNKDASGLKDTLDTILMAKISYFDAYEYCYHMLLLGLMADVDAVSNRESGTGRTDITLKRGGTVAILELKRSYSELYMNADALKGIMQIRDRLYGKELEIKGFSIIHYGISFCKKECNAILESEITNALIAEAVGDLEAAVLAIKWQIDKRATHKAKSSRGLVGHNKEEWYKSRKKALETLMDKLDDENAKFNFVRLLNDTERLLEDLQWLQHTEASKGASQTLFHAMLTHEK